MYPEKKKNSPQYMNHIGPFRNGKTSFLKAVYNEYLSPRMAARENVFFFIIQNLLTVPISLSTTITKDSFGEKRFSH